MADDAPVTVTLKATLRDYEAALKAALRTTEATANRAEQLLANIGKGARPGRAIQQDFRVSTTQMLGDARTLQYQLDDIFSSIGSSQGVRAMRTVLGQIAGQLSGGPMLLGARTMGAALMGITNPINLAVLAFGFAASAAMRYFRDGSDGSKELAERMKQEAQLLDTVVGKWGDLVPMLQKVKQARDEVLAQEQLSQATANEIRKEYEGARAAIQALLPQMRRANRELRPGGAVGTAAEQQLTNVWNALRAATEPTIEQIEAVEAALEKVRQEAGWFSDKKVFDELARELQSLKPGLDAAASATAQLRDNQVHATTAQKELNDMLAKMADVAKRPVSDMERLLQLYQQALDAASKFGDAAARAEAERAATAQYEAGVQRITDAATDAEIRDYVRGRIQGMIRQESGGNAAAKNPKSTATGLGQFIESTWLRLFPQVYPGLAAGASRQQQLAFRTDPNISRRMTEELAAENIKQMRAAGTIIVDGATYLAHFLGSAGAQKVLKAAPSTPVSQLGLGADVIAANREVFAKRGTAGALIEWAAGVENATGKTTKAVKEQKKQFDDLYAANEKRIEQQRRVNEIEADGTATVNERKAAVEALKLEEALLDAARQQGLPITAELSTKIKQQAQDMAALGLANAEVADRQRKFADEQRKISEEAKRFSQEVANIGQTAISGLVNDLRNGVSAGEAFRNVLDRIIDGLLNMAMQSMFSQNALGGLFGNIFGGGGGLFAGFSAGGTVGLSHHRDGRRLSPMLWANAPRFMAGGTVGLRPGEVPIIAHRGEIVLPRAVAQRGRGGASVTNISQQVGDISIDMSATGLVAADNQSGRQFGENVRKLVQAEMVNESRPGGLLRRIG